MANLSRSIRAALAAGFLFAVPAVPGIASAGGGIAFINAGGKAVSLYKYSYATDDEFFVGGNAATHPATGGSVGNNFGYDWYQLFETERYGRFAYDIPLPNEGTYRVRLYFAETYWTTVGKRIFDVSINGQTVLDNLDIVGRVGPNVGFAEDFNIEVPANNPRLYIDFSHADANYGVVNAIEVDKIAGPNVPPVADAGPDETVAVNDAFPLLEGPGGYDPDNTHVEYGPWYSDLSWEQIDGPSQMDCFYTWCTPSEEGDYTFRMTVTDGDGDSVSDDKVIHVRGEQLFADRFLSYGLEGWSIYVAHPQEDAIELASPDDVVFMSNGAANNVWDMQLRQIFEVHAGEVYNMSFTVQTTSGNTRPVNLYMQENGGDWTVFGSATPMIDGTLRTVSLNNVKINWTGSVKFGIQGGDNTWDFRVTEARLVRY